MPSVNVYLDSSDYSTMSSLPHSETALARTRDRLLAFAASHEVEFWYSSAHITEMAPLAPQHANAAASRTDLLVSLCGRRALVSVEGLLALELQAVREDVGPPNAVWSRTGDWFPEISDLISPLEPPSESLMLDEVQSQGWGRKERRRLEKKVRKQVRRAGGVQSAMAKARNDDQLAEITEKYPMTKEAAAVLRDFVVGHATRQQAEEAFLSCLRDPRWMMRWFEDHAEKLSPLHEWVRKPAQQMRERMVRAAEDLNSSLTRQDALRESARVLGVNLAPGKTGSRAEFSEELDRVIPATVAKMASDLMHFDLPARNAEIIARNAPGLTTCLRVLFEVVRGSVGRNPRKMKDSDFVDCLHAMYAPYVDVFRADAYMGPIVAEATREYGTTVVSRREELVLAIEARLAARVSA